MAFLELLATAARTRVVAPDTSVGVRRKRWFHHTAGTATAPLHGGWWRLAGRHEANLGTFHIQSKAGAYDAELKSHDNTDIVVVSVDVAPGGHSGWHFRPGPVLVIVKTGTITFYMGDDPTCTPHVHPAGTTFFENGGMVGIARNEGTVAATVVATFFVPAGSPTRLDAPASGNCAF